MTSSAEVEVWVSTVSAVSAASISAVDCLDRDGKLLRLVVNLADFRDRSGVFPVDRGRCRSLVAAWKERIAALKDVRSITQSFGQFCSSSASGSRDTNRLRERWLLSEVFLALGGRNVPLIRCKMTCLVTSSTKRPDW